jgi:transcriptional regulator with XRE-family HTH domain
MDTTPTDFADKAGISISYASELLRGKRTPGARLAIDIFRRTGRRFGVVTLATDADIDALDRMTPPRIERAA